MNRRNVVLAAVVACSGAVLAERASAERSAPRCSEEMSALLLKHARKHGVPIDLLHRIVIRESRYNAAAHHSRYYGLMQITYATAKSMGYEGKASGLLDAETNLTYAVPYLANAYMLSHGNDDRAVRLYAAGYYATAKQQHMIADLRTAGSPAVVPVRVAIVEADAPRNPVAQLFGMLTSRPDAAPPVEARTAAPDAATQPAVSSEADAKSDAVAAAEKDGHAESGRPVHAAAAKVQSAKTAAADEIRVASAAEAPAKADDHMQGAAAPVSAGLTPAATPETQAPAVAAGKPPKPQLAAAKAKSKPSRFAKTTRPVEPATEVADAVDPGAAGEDQPAADAAPAAKASAPTKARTRTAKKQVAAAEPAPVEAAGEQQTSHVAQRAKAKPRHAHVLQAAASKADVDSDQ